MMGDEYLLSTAISPDACRHRLALQVEWTVKPSRSKLLAGTVTGDSFVVLHKSSALELGLASPVAFGRFEHLPHGGTAIAVRFAAHPVLLNPILGIVLAGLAAVACSAILLIVNRQSVLSQPVPFILAMSFLPFGLLALWACVALMGSPRYRPLLTLLIDLFEAEVIEDRRSPALPKATGG